MNTKIFHLSFCALITLLFASFSFKQTDTADKEKQLQSKSYCGPHVIVRNQSSTSSLIKKIVIEGNFNSYTYYVNIRPGQTLDIGSMSVDDYTATLSVASEHIGSIKVTDGTGVLACVDLSSSVFIYTVSYYGSCQLVYIDVTDDPC